MILLQPVGSFFTMKLVQAWMHMGSLSGVDQSFFQKTSLGLSSVATRLDTTDKGIKDKRWTWRSPSHLWSLTLQCGMDRVSCSLLSHL